MDDKSPKIAIIGSGPSGCYAAQFLRKAWRDAEIIVFESLPVPYGLMRYGVAADHQGSKAVEAQFTRIFQRDGVLFAGNVTVGVDIPFEELAASFDIVVLATGLRVDRHLTMDVGAECRVYGAGEILRALNGFPEPDLPLRPDGTLTPLGSNIGIIGNGNVAMDVVRILAKPLSQFDGSDIDDARLTQLRANGIERIEIFGRSPIVKAKFDLAMFREILALENVSVSHSGVEMTEDCPSLRLLVDRPQAKAQVNIGFHFEAAPVSYLDGAQGPVLTVEHRQAGNHGAFALDSLITAIGFTSPTVPLPSSAELWHADHVYRCGWLANGGQGTMAENRKSAKAVSTEIAQAAARGKLAFGAPGYAALAPRLAERVVDFDGWLRIDAHERAAAPGGRVRRKLTDLSEMVAVAGTLHDEPELRSAG